MRHKPPTVFSYHEIKVENRCVANRRHSDIEELVYIHNYIKNVDLRIWTTIKIIYVFRAKIILDCKIQKTGKPGTRRLCFYSYSTLLTCILIWTIFWEKRSKLPKAFWGRKNKNINSWKYSIRVMCLRLRQFVFSHISVHNYFAHIINRRKMYNTHLISNYRHFNIFCKIHFALF